jgi:hypothetical protein
MSHRAGMKKGTFVPQFSQHKFWSSVRPRPDHPARSHQAHKRYFLHCLDSGRQRQPRKCRFCGSASATRRSRLTVSPFRLRFLLCRSWGFPSNEPVPCLVVGGVALNRQRGRVGRGITQLHESSLRFRCVTNRTTGAVNLWLIVKKGIGKNLVLDQNPQSAEASATFLQHSRARSASTLASAGVQAAISLFGMRGKAFADSRLGQAKK